MTTYDLGKVKGDKGDKGDPGDTRIRTLIDSGGFKGVVYNNGFGYVVFNASAVRISEGKALLHKVAIPGVAVNAVLGSEIRMQAVDGNGEQFERFHNWFFLSYAEGGQATIKGVNVGGAYGGACDLNCILYFK